MANDTVPDNLNAFASPETYSHLALVATCQAERSLSPVEVARLTSVFGVRKTKTRREQP